MSMVLFGSDIRVEGNLLSKAKTFSYGSIKEMKKLDIDSKPVVCASGETKAQASTYSGVLLRQIVDGLPLEIQNKSDFNSIVITVIAGDNYQVNFTYNELFNTSIGDGVMISYAKDSKAIADKELVLLSANDIKTGPRNVKNIKEIRVNVVKYEVNK